MSSAPAPSELLYFAERGSGRPLLLVHGLMVTGEMFEPVVGQLATQHRVIVPDLRGHGRSRALPPPYTAAQLAADLADLLDHLRVDTTAVLGYSQGGAIAQQLALDHPSRCDRLVLACTYAFNMRAPGSGSKATSCRPPSVSLAPEAWRSSSSHEPRRTWGRSVPSGWPG